MLLFNIYLLSLKLTSSKEATSKFFAICLVIFHLSVIFVVALIDVEFKKLS